MIATRLLRSSFKRELELMEPGSAVELYAPFGNFVLTGEEKMDLADLLWMQRTKFFAGRDEYICLHTLEGALSRFRQSREGIRVDSVRRRPTVVDYGNYIVEKNIKLIKISELVHLKIS